MLSSAPASFDKACQHSNADAGKGRQRVNYAGVLGKTVDIPAPVFDVDVPDLFYRGTVLKKDRAHPGRLLTQSAF